MLVVSRGAAGRVAISALGVRVVGRGCVMSPWCAACVRRPEMQQHEVWTSPEEVVRHWPEIFSRAYPTHRSRRPPGLLDGQCLTRALRRVAPGLLMLVDYLLGTLHAWIREGANDLTLGRWWERYRMRDGQDCVGVRLRAVHVALYWRYRRVDFAFVMAPPIVRDRWRCPQQLGMIVRVLFHREALPPTARRRGRPFVPPMRWREAQHRVLLLEGWDPRGEGHGCAVDALVVFTTRSGTTPQRWSTDGRGLCVRCRRVCPTSRRGPSWRPTGNAGKPSESTGALASHTARTRFGATVGPGLDGGGGGGTAVRSAPVPAPSCRGVRLAVCDSKMTVAAP